MEFSPDGSKIVSGSADKTIKVWDSGAFWAKISPLSPKLTLLGFPGSHAGTQDGEGQRAQRSILSVDFSPDGSKIVSGSSDKTIKVWDSGARFSEIPNFEPKLTASAS